MNPSRLLLLTLMLSFSLCALVRADTWTPTAIPPKTVGGSRSLHTAVWTGKEMIIWGGVFGSNSKSSGGRYDPVTNTWRPTTLEGAPTPHQGHTAVWAGDHVNRMIIYGGQFYPFNRDGGMYDPETDRWTKIEIDGDRAKQIPVPRNVPSSRAYHSAVWTGKEMIVWGGHCIGTCHRNDGAAYNPSTNTWRTIQTPSFLAARSNASAFWTGTKMLIWGGARAQHPFNDGGLYDPETDEWTAITMTDAPSPRILYSAVWTGKEMIVWGGQYTRADGKIYDPVLDRWRPMSTKGLPQNAKKQPLGRQTHTAVWTGKEMIMWGGQAPSGDPYRGARYNPEIDQWLMISKKDTPTNRIYYTAVWGENEMIVWGGRGGPEIYGITQTGGVYRPGCSVHVLEPNGGDRVNREVTFRIHAGTLTDTPQQAQLLVDGVPHGEWRPVQSDSRIKFTLGDEFAGSHKLQIKTSGAGGGECLSWEVPVEVGPTVKVLRLIFDPKADFLGSQTFRQHFKWNDPLTMTDEYIDAIDKSSGGFAKYEVVDDIVYDGYAQQINGHAMNDDEYFNRSSNTGWANLAWYQPNEPMAWSAREVGLGDDPQRMKYAQSFKVWGAGLKGVKVVLRKVGSPRQPIRISVRSSLDGADMCTQEGDGGWCGATIAPDDVPTASAHVEVKGTDFELPLANNVLYYLVVQYGQDASATPDPNNYYMLHILDTPGGHIPHTDAEAEFFEGATRSPGSDMSVMLNFTDRVDYKLLLERTIFDGKDRTIAQYVRDGLVDEVYAFGGPLIGMWESAMMGPGAFNINGDPWPDIDSGRAFVVMGFNYQRTSTEMFHNYGHRTEFMMEHIYGGWANSAYDRTIPTTLPAETNWDKFTSFRGTSALGQTVQCGAVHFPPNALNEENKYNYPSRISSACDDWLNYPNFKGTKRVINAAAWGSSEIGFLKWWFTRMPRAKGRNPDGKLNNWWRYVVEPDYYK